MKWQEKISDDIIEIKEILAAQKVILIEHQRRSDLNEKAIEILMEELKPLRDHIIKVQSVIPWIKVVIGSGFIIEILRLVIINAK